MKRKTDNSIAEVRITIYEYNLEVWRQFWIVIERSNVICEIVDSRSPLSYSCRDIYQICRENNLKHILVLNKSDLLNGSQKEHWQKYFDSKGQRCIFWSNKDQRNNFETLQKCITQCFDINDNNQSLNIGFVGYPNVGKSSMINFLTHKKAVAESSTPGKTKICQTIVVSEQCQLFDCPGLYIPKYFTDESDVALMGIYPVDQITKPEEVVRKIIARIPIQHLMKQLNLDYFSQFNDDFDQLINSYGGNSFALICLL